MVSIYFSLSNPNPSLALPVPNSQSVTFNTVLKEIDITSVSEPRLNIANGPYTVSLYDGRGTGASRVPFTRGATVSLAATTSNANGTFYSDARMATSITQIVIPNGSSTGTFYYRDVSAAEGKGLEEVFKKVELVARERRKRISTGNMNRFLDRIDFGRASVPMNKRVRIYYMTQAAVAPPTFVLFTDRDVKLHFSYVRFLANEIRKAFRFIGSPIWFKIKPRNKKEA